MDALWTLPNPSGTGGRLRLRESEFRCALPPLCPSLSSPLCPPLPSPASLRRVSPPPPLPRQPPKTIFVDNKRVPFENDEAYQQFLSRARAAGLTGVRGKTEIDQVEVLCMNLDAIHDGQSYTFFPPKVTGQSEALQFKGMF